MTYEDVGGGAVDGGPARNIAQLVFASEFLRQRTQPILTPREQNAMPTAARQQAGDLRADAGRRARYDRYPRHTRTVRA